MKTKEKMAKQKLVLSKLFELNDKMEVVIQQQAQTIIQLEEDIRRYRTLHPPSKRNVTFNQDIVIRLSIHKLRGPTASLGLKIITPISTALFPVTNCLSWRFEKVRRSSVTRRSTVSSVTADGSADLAGLRVGDVLLSVNGKDLSNATHEETVNSLNTAQEPITVEVLRRPSNSTAPDITERTTTQSTMNTVATQTDDASSSGFNTCCNRMFVVPAPPPLYSSLEEVSELANSTSELELAAEELCYDVEYDEVTLHRTSVNDKIGLTLCYEETEQDGVLDVFIDKVEADSIAGRCGRIRELDQIVKINNKEVRSREEAITLFKESEACSDICLLICRAVNLDQMDDGFLEGYSNGNFNDDFYHTLLHTQDMKTMPLIEEERSEFEDESTLTDTATLPSQKEKEAKDSGVGQDSAGSSEQECDSSHYDTLNMADESVLTEEIVEDQSKFRQLLESRCVELAQHCDNNNRVVPRMGTKIRHHGADQTCTKIESTDGHDTAYNTADSLPNTLELTKNHSGSSFSLSESKKHSRQSHDRRRSRRSSPKIDQSTTPNHSDITYTTEDKLAEIIAQQQKVLLEQTKSSTLTRETNTTAQDTGNVSDSSNMEWVVKRRSDGTYYPTRRPIRTRMLSERKKKLETERCGMTTDDDAMSEMKTGRHWSKEERRRHLQKSRERHQRKAMMQQQIDMVKKAARQGQTSLIELSNKKLHKHTMKDLDFTTVQELLAHQGKIPISSRNLISVTTV